MFSNCEYIRKLPGILKSVSILLVSVTLTLAAVGTLNSKYVTEREKFEPIFKGDVVNLWREILFIAVAGACLIMSLINLLTYVSSKSIYWNRRMAIYDFLYHACCFCLLSCSGVLNIISAVRIFEINCTSDNECQNFELKFAAGGLALLSSVSYGVIGAVVLTNRKDVERDGLLNEDK